MKWKNFLSFFEGLDWSIDWKKVLSSLKQFGWFLLIISFIMFLLCCPVAFLTFIGLFIALALWLPITEGLRKIYNKFGFGFHIFFDFLYMWKWYFILGVVSSGLVSGLVGLLAFEASF